MGVRTILGSASLKANDWVQAFQNPFGQELSKLYDPLKSASNAGTLNYQQAQDALTEFNQQWTAFDASAQQWKAKGGDYAKVVSQSYDPNGKFMQTVNMVKDALTDWTGSLPNPNGGKPTGPDTPPSLQTILGQLGLSPDDAAQKAASNVQRKAQSETQTILTGSHGLSEVSSANRKTRTLLGYA
jgi:hypothetical protein